MLPDKLGRLPLHLATRQGSPHYIIAALVAAQPKALKVADSEGNLPLHYAILYQSNTTVQMMIDRYPDACQVVNHRRRTPLHLACGCRPDDDSILTTLIKAYPGALELRDRNDKLPLHVLCGSQTRSFCLQWDTLQRMIAWCPSACIHRDLDGLTPLKIMRQHVPPYDLLYVCLRDCTKKEKGKLKKSLTRRVENFFTFRLQSCQRGR